jgi:hypothetical protein
MIEPLLLGQHGLALIAKDGPRIGHFEQGLALFFARCPAGQVSAFLGVLVILGRFFSQNTNAEIAKTFRKFKLGHCQIQNRPLGVKTGQYLQPNENK